MRATFTVKYKMNPWSEEKSVDVIASSKRDAYEQATYDIIPDKEPYSPYSTWVSSVTYNNGNCHHFNTSEGNAY